MTFFGPDLRNGLPIGLGSVAGFGIAPRFSPASLFAGGINGAWYDPSDPTTLFSDRAGTTPCAAPGAGAVVPVGAMLDERATGYSVYFDGTGDYLSFASDSGLALGAGQYTVELWVYLTASVNFGVFFSVTGGLQFSTNASNNVAVALQGVAFQLESTTPVTLNQWAHLAVTRDSGNTTRIFLNGSQIASAVITTNYGQGVSYANYNVGLPSAFHAGYYANLRAVKGIAVYTGNFTPPTSPLSPITGTSLLTCGASWSGNPAITKNGDARVDGLNPFQASPVGNHAIAANDTTARPELSARVNLLTRTEEFDNAAWTKGALTVSANATTAPDGTTTADKLQETTANAEHYAFQSITAAATPYTFSVYLKAAERTWANLYFTTGSVAKAYFDLANGVVGTLSAGVTAAISDAGNGWWRCQITVTATATTFYAIINPALGDNQSVIYAGTSGSGIFAWGADLRVANIGTTIPAYQRIADQYTYDNVGFPRYLAYNGTSSAMSTPANVNLSGTDKATVFAGVRKTGLVNVTGFIAETSIAADSNNGAFRYGIESGGIEYFPGSRGTAFQQILIDNAAYAPPVSNVLQASFDIAAPLVSARINAVSVGTNTGSQGTGNFGSYPLFVGSRNNGVGGFWFNGYLYSLIVAGSAVSAGNITATEQWVAGKTGITI